MACISRRREWWCGTTLPANRPKTMEEMKMKQIIRCVSIVLGLLIVVGASADKPAPNVADRRVILTDYKCEPVGRGKPASWGCINGFGGCQGVCYEGVYGEDALVCKPSPGSTCVARRGTVLVIATHEGVCTTDCSCKEMRRIDEDTYRFMLEVYRCNT